MPLTLRQLTYFAALADQRSFGAAAAQVHVTQPALSMQIRDLERTLGVTLIERGPRSLHLTRQGRDLLIHARRILAEVTELESAARRKMLGGRLHLGLIPTVAPYLLPRALPSLRSHDGIPDLRIREARTRDLMADLAIGALDAVVAAEPADSSGLHVQPLFSDHFVLAGSAERLARAAQGIEHLRPSGLDPDQLLLLDEGHCLADQALEVCGLTRTRLRLDLGAASLSTLCGLVGQGVGLTFLPEISVTTESAAQPQMRLLRFAAPQPARRIVLMRRLGTDGAGWFDALARVLTAAGTDLIGALRT
jgi:LysR family hydrogen peroxide-inducible transcriptional activator